MPPLADAPSDFAARLAQRWHSCIALVGRIAMGLIFLTSGYGKITNVEGFASVLAKRGVPAPSLLGWIGAIVEFFGGIMIILGVKLRYVAGLMILFVIIATAISHRYWEFAGADLAMQRTNFWKNVTIIGGLLFMFLAGAGRLSVDGLLGRDKD